MNDCLLAERVLTFTFPNLLIESIFLQHEFGFRHVIDDSSTVFNNDLFHSVQIDGAVLIASMMDCEEFALEDVLADDDFVPLALESL